MFHVKSLNNYESNALSTKIRFSLKTKNNILLANECLFKDEMPLFVVKLFQEMHFRDILCRNFLAYDHTLYTILWVTTTHFFIWDV